MNFIPICRSRTYRLPSKKMANLSARRPKRLVEIPIKIMSAPRLFATEKISIFFLDRRNKTHKRTIQGRCRFKSKIKERFRTKIKERCKKSKNGESPNPSPFARFPFCLQGVPWPQTQKQTSGMFLYLPLSAYFKCGHHLRKRQNGRQPEGGEI